MLPPGFEPGSEPRKGTMLGLYTTGAQLRKNEETFKVYLGYVIARKPGICEDQTC